MYIHFNVIQAAKTSVNTAVYQTIFPPHKSLEMRLLREVYVCVHYNDTSWLTHLCRLTGYNADPERTEGQGILFEMTSQMKLLYFFCSLVCVHYTKEH